MTSPVLTKIIENTLRSLLTDPSTTGRQLKAFVNDPGVSEHLDSVRLGSILNGDVTLPAQSQEEPGVQLETEDAPSDKEEKHVQRLLIYKHVEANPKVQTPSIMDLLQKKYPQLKKHVVFYMLKSMVADNQLVCLKRKGVKVQSWKVGTVAVKETA